MVFKKKQRGRGLQGDTPHHPQTDLVMSIVASRLEGNSDFNAQLNALTRLNNNIRTYLNPLVTTKSQVNVITTASFDAFKTFITQVQTYLNQSENKDITKVTIHIYIDQSSIKVEFDVYASYVFIYLYPDEENPDNHQMYSMEDITDDKTHIHTLLQGYNFFQTLENLHVTSEDASKKFLNTIMLIGEDTGIIYESRLKTFKSIQTSKPPKVSNSHQNVNAQPVQTDEWTLYKELYPNRTPDISYLSTSQISFLLKKIEMIKMVPTNDINQIINACCDILTSDSVKQKLSSGVYSDIVFLDLLLNFILNKKPDFSKQKVVFDNDKFNVEDIQSDGGSRRKKIRSSHQVRAPSKRA